MSTPYFGNSVFVNSVLWTLFCQPRFVNSNFVKPWWSRQFTSKMLQERKIVTHFEKQNLRFHSFIAYIRSWLISVHSWAARCQQVSWFHGFVVYLFMHSISGQQDVEIKKPANISLSRDGVHETMKPIGILLSRDKKHKTCRALECMER